MTKYILLNLMGRGIYLLVLNAPRPLTRKDARAKWSWREDWVT